MHGAPSVLAAGPGRAVPEEVGRLVALMDGCRDDPEGLTAKITLTTIEALMWSLSGLSAAHRTVYPRKPPWEDTSARHKRW